MREIFQYIVECLIGTAAMTNVVAPIQCRIRQKFPSSRAPVFLWKQTVLNDIYGSISYRYQRRSASGNRVWSSFLVSSSGSHEFLSIIACTSPHMLGVSRSARARVSLSSLAKHDESWILDVWGYVNTEARCVAAQRKLIRAGGGAPLSPMGR